MNRAVVSGVCIIGILYLSACTTLATKSDRAVSSNPELNQRHLASIAAISDFALEGRLGIQTDGRGISGSLRWQHINSLDAIELFSPMGGKMAEVKTEPGNVTLTSSDGKTYSAVDAETLTEQTLGWRLPVGYLSDWVIGRPAPGDIERSSWDNEGKLIKLYQDGWEVEYLEYRTVIGQQLPSKLTLRNTKLYIKLIIERWDIERWNMGRWDMLAPPQSSKAGTGLSATSSLSTALSPHY